MITKPTYSELRKACDITNEFADMLHSYNYVFRGTDYSNRLIREVSNPIGLGPMLLEDWIRNVVLGGKLL